MALISGQKLGPYEIIQPIGKGGMGEVYSAKDTRLNRTVAIKVLPAGVAANSELRERFDREARSISSLNHPNVCTLFDVGHQDGTDFLVMEFIEGETLAERLDRGKMPLEEVLTIGIQVASALESAHRRGLVHRDLKPGNIMLTKAGAKLVDFGLARLAAGDAIIAGGDELTRTTPLTGQGSIVGTLQYMAPEQLEGQEVDHRADIFAFGAVLYEMVTGQRAFRGGSQASLIASILKEDPPSLRDIQVLSPRMLERAVSQCVAKDPDQRWQSAGDLRRELAWIKKELESPVDEESLPVGRSASRAGNKYVLGGALLIIVALATVIVAGLFRSGGSPAATDKFVLPVLQLAGGFDNPVTISPNGRMIVYPADGKLWLRDLGRFDPEQIPETQDVNGIFWSPDSRILSFGQMGRIWKYDVESKERTALCDIPESGRIIGGCWSPTGEIVMAVWRGGLYRLTDRGGTPELIIASDSTRVHDFHTPHFMPDGKTLLLYLHAKKNEENGIVILGKDRSEMKSILLSAEIGGAAWSPSGHILYTKGGREESIWALPFSADKLEPTGDPFPVAAGGQYPTVSDNGTMAYYTTRERRKYQMNLYSRSKGTFEKVGAPIAGWRLPIFSPDGKRILYTANENGMWNLWEHDLVRGTARRLTNDSSMESQPSWFPSGDKFVFSRDLGVARGTIEVFNMAVGAVTDSIGEGQGASLSHDGRYVIYTTDVKGNLDLWYTDLQEKSPPKPLLRTSIGESDGAFSRDDKWFAYEALENRTRQIFLRTFPDALQPMQVSIDGGYTPFWHPSGDTLFWVYKGNVYGVGIQWKGGPILGIPHKELESNPNDSTLEGSSGMDRGSIAISPDGKYFVIGKPVDEGETSRLQVVLNWYNEFADRR